MFAAGGRARGQVEGKNPHLKCIPTTADAVNFVDMTVLCLPGMTAFSFVVVILLVVLKLFLTTDLENPFMSSLRCPGCLHNSALSEQEHPLTPTPRWRPRTALSGHILGPAHLTSCKSEMEQAFPGDPGSGNFRFA